MQQSVPAHAAGATRRSIMQSFHLEWPCHGKNDHRQQPMHPGIRAILIGLSLSCAGMVIGGLTYLTAPQSPSNAILVITVLIGFVATVLVLAGFAWIVLSTREIAALATKARSHPLGGVETGARHRSPASPSAVDFLQRLSQHRAIIQDSARPCLRFTLHHEITGPGTSRLGGAADLAPSQPWPHGNRGPLDFLLQIDLSEISSYAPAGLLPRQGLLSFFYNLDSQPWGFDPADLQEYRVVYTAPEQALATRAVPRPSLALQPMSLRFRLGTSVPLPGSRDYDRLMFNSGMAGRADQEVYDVYARSLASEGGTPEDPSHQLFGYANPIQGDMQLEAQLVTHGLSCGDARAYSDPRAQLLEPGADDWQLLLQLDSDDGGGFMWGDAGILYFWIRRQDLQVGAFDKVWMSLQCF